MCMTSAPPDVRDEELLADVISRLIGDVRHVAVGNASVGGRGCAITVFCTRGGRHEHRGVAHPRADAGPPARLLRLAGVPSARPASRTAAPPRGPVPAATVWLAPQPLSFPTPTAHVPPEAYRPAPPREDCRCRPTARPSAPGAGRSARLVAV